jgi:PIN domain nuclease of toxin-antitoxin system
LLDTHTLLWSVDDSSRISGPAMSAMQNSSNNLVLSAATIWELAIKTGLGKLTLSMPYRQWMESAVTDLDLEILPITVAYGERLTMLAPHHKDPFDRMLVAQALVDGIPVVGIDPAFDPYGVTRIW